MDKIKRILAMTAVTGIVICALLTLIFALLTNFGVGDFTNAWKASAWCMVVIPVFIYAMLLIYRILDGKGRK
jgi:predicted anti-sigma-YlaC factor YlaD